MTQKEIWKLLIDGTIIIGKHNNLLYKMIDNKLQYKNIENDTWNISIENFCETTNLPFQIYKEKISYRNFLTFDSNTKKYDIKVFCSELHKTESDRMLGFIKWLGGWQDIEL